MDIKPYLIGIILLIISYGYYKIDQLKTENKQLQNNLSQLTTYNNSLKNIINNNDQIITKLNESNVQLNQNCSNLEKDLSNAKNSIRDLNVIRGNLVQYINRSIKMSKIPKSTTITYESSARYDAYRFTEGIIINNNICQKNAIQLKALQDWISSTIGIFNK